MRGSARFLVADVLSRCGWVRQDFDIAKKAIHGVTNGEIELEHKDVSVKGWNWGKMDVRGKSFVIQSMTLQRSSQS
jgi:predicted transcriptional regulator